MQFATLDFVAFFLVVFTVSWLVRGQRTLQKLVLLLASWAFYAGWSGKLLALIALSSGLNWAAGEAITRLSRGRGVVLGVAVAANLVTLGFFKYFDFFRGELERLFGVLGLGWELPIVEILPLLGISFYTFQSIAYVVDLHRGHGVRARSLLDYFLFIAFFPQLLIGPICRSRDLLPQLEAPAPKGIPDLSLAVSLVLSGLFKKMILSTWLATHIVNDTFQAPENYSSVELLVAAWAYTAMIYCDFSGYTDMARGLALLLGFQIPDNFAAPYAATNIAEFWRRWHITFSNWLRDYVYLPLGGSRRAHARVYLNLMITLFVAGLWHGANWTYVVWGTLHGLALVAHKMVQDWRRARGVNTKTLRFPWWYLVLGWLYTMHLNTALRIFFYSADLETAGMYFLGLAKGTLYGRGFEWLVLPIVALVFAMNFWGTPARDAFCRWHERLPWAARPVVWAVAGLALLALQPADVAPYVYFRF